MTSAIIGGFLIGAVLGRFYRALILLPSSALAFAAVMAISFFNDHHLWHAVANFVVLALSTQAAFALTQLLRAIPGMWRRSKTASPAALRHPDSAILAAPRRGFFISMLRPPSRRHGASDI
ncbi:MAG TPA: hypothetical protein VFG05_13550 [Methylocella sp.]|nr:hypothetical protein [Methylocella sp.]